jgi:uracil-DNA glycosylase family 4
MRVLFVGSNPSRSQRDTSVPFAGARSQPRLDRWVTYIMSGVTNYSVQFANVSPTVTEGNRPLKVSEWQLDGLYRQITLFQPNVIVTLGKTAEKALLRLPFLSKKNYALPHPSGRNRLLNDPEYEKRCLEDCRRFIEEKL